MAGELTSFNCFKPMFTKTYRSVAQEIVHQLFPALIHSLSFPVFSLPLQEEKARHDEHLLLDHARTDLSHYLTCSYILLQQSHFVQQSGSICNVQVLFSSDGMLLQLVC